MKKLASYIVVLVVTAAAAYLLGAQDAKNERNQELEEKVKLYAGMVVFYQHEDEREDIMDDIEKCLVEWDSASKPPADESEGLRNVKALTLLLDTKMNLNNRIESFNDRIEALDLTTKEGVPPGEKPLVEIPSID